MPFLSFIPSWLAVAFIVIGLLGLVFKNKLALMIARWNPLFPANTTLIILAIVGILAGGIAVIGGAIGGLSTATVSPTQTAPSVSSAILERCDFAAGTGLSGNQTVRADPNSINRVYLDIDGTEFITYSAAGTVNVTFTCVREGSTQEAESYMIVVKGDEFRSETSTTDSAIYNVLATSSNPSSIWSGKYRQTVYLADGGYATTSGTQEYGYLQFTAGQKTETLGILGTVDATSFGHLNNYTQKQLTVYQRVDGSDSAIGYIVINKLP